MALDVTLWGTRGSIPTPGPTTVRHGGNTACVEVVSTAGHRLILDAGTGIRLLGKRLGPPSNEATILLTHTHWDHIQGLPFFAPLYQADERVRLLGPAQPGPSLEAVIHSLMAPAVFPVPVSALAATWTVTEIGPGPLALEGFEAACIRVCHPGETLAYRIRDRAGSAIFSYMTDNELGGSAAAELRPDIVRFLQGTDTLVHDAMYFEAEVRERSGWGHSTAVQAVKLAVEAGVRHLVLFHHDPGHDDATLERLLIEANRCRERLGARLEIELAVEGSTVCC